MVNSPPNTLEAPTVLRLFPLLGLIAASWALAQTGGEIPRLDLGVVLPLTGEQAPFGKEAQRGVELALEMFRKKDAKLGSRVALVTADSKSLLSEVGPAAAKLLGKERCQMLVGGMTSPEAELLAAEALKGQSALVIPLATELEAPKGSVVTRLALDDAAQGKLLAQFAATRGIKAVAILKDEQDGSRRLAGSFASAFKASGGSVVADEGLDPTTLDYGLDMRRFVDAKATAVLLATSAPAALGIMKQAKNAGLELTFLGGELWDTPSLAQPMQQVGVQAFHMAAFAADDPSPEASAFVAAFEERHKRKPGGVAALAYDAASLALAAYARNPSAAKEALASSLAATSELTGATGTLRGGDRSGRKSKTGVVKQLGPDGARFAQRVAAP
jgi:branched-chain amino acid transport system substrate-binding protein